MISIYMCSHPGAGHANEDAIAKRVLDDQTVVCALADGQGGQHGGAAAASLAVRTALERSSELPEKDRTKTAVWQKLGETVDKAVHTFADAGYCTLIACLCTSNTVVGVSNGDSAALLLLESKAYVLTDHQIKNPPIGSGAAACVPFSHELDSEWKVVIMSDGVWKYIGWQALEQLCLSTPAESICVHLLKLMEQKWRSGLPDDFSIIVAHGNSRG